MIRRQRIPPVKQDKSFIYLGKDFTSKMTSDEIKPELKSEVRKYVEINDKLPIKCFHKIEIMLCFPQIEMVILCLSFY